MATFSPLSSLSVYGIYKYIDKGGAGGGRIEVKQNGTLLARAKIKINSSN